MFVTVDVTSESRYAVDRVRIRSVVERVLGVYSVDGVAVSVRIVGDRKMKELNETYRKIANTTDVLSFPTESFSKTEDKGFVSKAFVYPAKEPLPLGDIIVSYPKARLQAMEANRLIDEEIDALIEHGVKSLLGHHPDNESES